MMKFLARLGQMDRRLVFLLLFLAILAPLLLRIHHQLYIDKTTRDLYDRVEAIEPHGRPVLVSFDYDPQVQPELDPMARAVIRHCFARGVTVFGMSLQPQGDAIGEQILTQLAREFHKQNGVDYTFFGYRVGGFAAIINIGTGCRKAMVQDSRGVPYDSLPMMRQIHNYDDIPLVLTLAGSSWPQTWIVYAGTRYHANIACGVTAVMAPENYPFLQTGQLVGQLDGMKGAAEYEQLIEEAGYVKGRDVASLAMSAISSSHLLIIALILMGNIGYFVSKRLANKS